MTCWGSAKVNLRRCDDEVLRTVGTLAAGPVTANRLVALRENEPAAGPEMNCSPSWPPTAQKTRGTQRLVVRRLRLLFAVDSRGRSALCRWISSCVRILDPNPIL